MGESGSITVYDGSITSCSTKDNRKAVLGPISLRNKKTGDAIQTPVSSITLLDEKGNVSFKAP